MKNVPEKYKNHIAFQPASFRNITLPGRIVRSATEMFISDINGNVNESEFEIYNKLSQEPFGMVISAHTCVSPEGRSNTTQNAIWDDCFIDEQKYLADIIKSGGSKTILQIGHGGMKADGCNGGLTVYTPDTMSVNQIKETVQAFARAALRAKQAGFDGIQIHGAHMYLLSQFFYSQINHRIDKYGGTAERRFRIIREIAEAIKAMCGDDFPVFLKINGSDQDDTYEYFESLTEAAAICESCELEAMEISGYNSAPAGKVVKPYFFDTAIKLKFKTMLPIMLVGGIRSISDMELVLNSGIYTVSLSRPIIAQPDYITHLFNGETPKCISCNRCFGSIFDTNSSTRCIII